MRETGIFRTMLRRKFRILFKSRVVVSFFSVNCDLQGEPAGGMIFRLANKVFLKVADIAAMLEDYQKAIQRYEQVANASVNNNLMKWSLKEYFFKAGLCHLASGDLVTTKRALEHYKEMDMSFIQTRECQLLDVRFILLLRPSYFTVYLTI